MAKRNREFVVPLHITVVASDETDAGTVAREAAEDGLVEPGFIKDFMVGEGPFVELEPLTTDSEV